MLSECSDCDRPAIAYHGPYAYCRACLAGVQVREPDLHLCVRCGERQPVNVSWLRDAPCGTCQRNPQTDYAAYLLTEHWQRTRRHALERARHRCQVCNASDHRTKLDAHHRTYERLGREDDADLTVLCRECHELFHGRPWTKTPAARSVPVGENEP